MTCEEIIENIKNSLMQCKNNKSTYDLEQICNITDCENIQKYETSLHATKTKIIVNIPNNFSKYSIEYNVRERIIVLGEN